MYCDNLYITKDLRLMAMDLTIAATIEMIKVVMILVQTPVRQSMNHFI